jgi:hypothetical protein
MNPYLKAAACRIPQGVLFLTIASAKITRQITAFRYCLVPLLSATLLTDISVSGPQQCKEYLEMNTHRFLLIRSYFKAYDVRGIAGENLTEEVAYQSGTAVRTRVGHS